MADSAVATVPLLQQIADLWLLAAVICSFAALVIFRKEIAGVLARLASPQLAMSQLKQGYKKFNSASAKKTVLERIASLLRKAEDKVAEAIIREKALEISKNAKESFFSTAYSQASANLHRIAAANYSTDIVRAEKPQASQNNLAVAYDELKLPGMSVASYKAAAKAGNTLANANIAYRFIGAGFFEEAQQVLEEALKQEDVHPNVHTALSRIATVIAGSILLCALTSARRCRW